MIDTNCHASSSLSKLVGECGGQNSCAFSADNGVFGDPCGGTLKYLIVDYQCAAEKTALMYEEQSSSLSCPSGDVINVHYASYGKDACSASSSATKVLDSCGGKNSCTVRASNGVFGDPCPGIPKQLHVKYSCVNSATAAAAFSSSLGSAQLASDASYTGASLLDKTMLSTVGIVVAIAGVAFVVIRGGRRKSAEVDESTSLLTTTTA